MNIEATADLSIDIKIKSVIIETLVSTAEQITSRADSEARQMTEVEMATVLGLLEQVTAYSEQVLELVKKLSQVTKNA
jgi:hypothetical protein